MIEICYVSFFVVGFGIFHGSNCKNCIYDILYLHLCKGCAKDINISHIRNIPIKSGISTTGFMDGSVGANKRAVASQPIIEVGFEKLQNAN